jgi:uncharacterized protein
MIVSVNGGLTPLWQGGRVTMGLLALITGAIFFGSVAQRIAGIGFALLVAPILAILLGPHEGIMMINICAVVSCGLIVPRVWREINWNLLLWLSVPAVAGTVVGSWLAVQVPPAVLSTVVGAVVMAGLAVAVVLGRAQVTVSGQLPKVLAGLGSGLTNALAGVGGPTVSAYAILSRWPPRPFAATLQPFFLQLCLITVGVKLAVDPGSVPHLEWWMWAVIALAIIVGIFAGERIGRRLRDEHARAAVVVLAFLGAAGALAKGLVDLLA